MKLNIVAACVSTAFIFGAHTPAEAHGARHTMVRAHHRHASKVIHAQAGGLSGLASWYGPGFQGHRTANGERFNSNGLTAAHRSLPLGCHVLVTNKVNGRSVVVRINDRGPFGTGKVIDLSRASARAIGMAGSVPVTLSRL